MDMHRWPGEMIFSTMKNTAIELSKLITTLINVQTKLKLEKISPLEKVTKIKTLEDLVINLGYDPSDFKAVEEIIKKKKKNAYIKALREQLKLPSTEDPQTKDMDEAEQNIEDMLKLIIK